MITLVNGQDLLRNRYRTLPDPTRVDIDYKHQQEGSTGQSEQFNRKVEGLVICVGFLQLPSPTSSLTIPYKYISINLYVYGCIYMDRLIWINQVVNFNLVSNIYILDATICSHDQKIFYDKIWRN